MKENQTTEFKSKLNDKCFRTCCAFANTDGGKLYLGYDDDGNLTGLVDTKDSITDLPNTLRNKLDLYVSIYACSQDGKDYVEITIPKVDHPIFYEGKIYVRVGSTNQLLEGNDLIEFILRKSKGSWDDVTVDAVSLDDLDEESFRIFRTEGLKNKRISEEDAGLDQVKLLEKMSLIRNGKLTRATVLLFYSHPEYFFSGAHIKLGYFNDDGLLRYQDELYGSLLSLAKKIEEILVLKYMYATIDYDGLTRVETLPYAREAIREGILNALMHNNYMSAQPIAIRVSPRELRISNMCIFPSGWTEKTLFSIHESRQLNPNVAAGFFRAGMVERFGSGIRKILDFSKTNGNPKPSYTIYPEMITLNMPSRPENIKLALNNDGTVNGTVNDTVNGTVKAKIDKLSEREKQILNILERNQHVTLSEISAVIGVSRRTVNRDIIKLKAEELLTREGSDKQGRWTIIKEVGD
ncbi:MAG: putative DNA binding domain-containing protein [Sphaerochaetaceae bacterium]|nr:putative DNA binding domain-containing protein [Sphaerochaetaceae bacterium]